MSGVIRTRGEEAEVVEYNRPNPTFFQGSAAPLPLKGRKLEKRKYQHQTIFRRVEKLQKKFLAQEVRQKRKIFRNVEVRVEGGETNFNQPLLCLQHVQLCHCATCQGSSYTKNE